MSVWQAGEEEGRRQRGRRRRQRGGKGRGSVVRALCVDVLKVEVKLYLLSATGHTATVERAPAAAISSSSSRSFSPSNFKQIYIFHILLSRCVCDVCVC